MQYVKSYLKYFLLINTSVVVFLLFLFVGLFNVMSFTFENVVGMILLTSIANLVPASIMSAGLVLLNYLKEPEDESRE